MFGIAPRLRAPARLRLGDIPYFAIASRCNAISQCYSQIKARRYSAQTEWKPLKTEHHGFARVMVFMLPIVTGLAVYAQLDGPLKLDTAQLSNTNNSEQNSSTQGTNVDLCTHPSYPSHPGNEDFTDTTQLPREKAPLTTAPYVPAPITRDYPALLEVCLVTSTKLERLTSQNKYDKWNFNGTVPGPFIRARVGDVVELSLTNQDESGNPHNIDCHAFLGPGGGSALTTAGEGQTKTARFRLQCPGLYLYHCAAAPVPVHIANGMYGLMYVQPAENLPSVDHEYYVMQSEFYHEPPEIEENGKPSQQVEFSYPNALREEPSVVVFNGHEDALTTDKPLKAQVGETVRIFFGNAGPNFTSSFHVIGSNFNRVYRDSDVLSPPAQYVQTQSVPPGGTTIVDMKMLVPGTYTLVDHAIFRLEKGAVGYLNVSGPPQPGIYQSREPPAPCVGCKLHP